MGQSHPHYQPSILRCPPKRETAWADLFSGILVGVVALPLAIAFAIASGASPEAGLVTGVIAGLCISIFGGSRFQIGGPTGAFVGLCAMTIATHGLAGLALATIMAGILLILLGVLRLGSVVRLIPAPVVTGFTSGIAIIIASTQLRDSLGLSLWPSENPAQFHERILATWNGLASWNPWSLGLCLSTVSIIVILRRYLPRWPGALLALLGISLITALLDLPVETISDRFGELPLMIPTPSLSVFDDLGIHSFSDIFAKMLDLSQVAFAIGMLAAIESLLSATVADSMGKDQHDSDSELIGQGIANILTPFFGGLPATGAIARTATSIRSGSRSPLAGIVHALTLLLIMLVATPLVAYIPMATLAGVLLVVAWYMSEMHHWPHILKAGRSDALLLPLSFFLTVFMDLTVAVEVGVILGMFFFVRRLSQAAHIRVWRDDAVEADRLSSSVDPSIEIFEIDGPFFFGMSVHLRNLLAGIDPEHQILILRMRRVPFIDATAAMALRDLLDDCQEQNRQVILSGITDDCREDLERHDILNRLKDGCVTSNIQEAMIQARQLNLKNEEEQS